MEAQAQPTGPAFPNVGQAVSAGYFMTQAEDGSGGFVVSFEKQVAGESAKQHSLPLRAVGTGATMAVAKDNALANLNAQRALRYGAGPEDNSGTYDESFTHVPDKT